MQERLVTNLPRAADAGPLAPNERIDLLDILRGFALFGILVVNMAVFKSPLIGVAPPTDLLDRAATWLIAFAFETKFYVLFSFLFGYGLSVQIGRAEARGVALAPRYLRRLLGLFLLGIAHAFLLYIGDILVAYALISVILFLMRRRSSRALLVTAMLLVGSTAAFFLLTGLLVLATGGIEGGVDTGGADQIATITEAYRGDPGAIIAQRARDYPTTLAFALFAQGPTVLAMFLVGLWSGRRGVMARPGDYLTLLRRLRIVGLAVGIPGAAIWATHEALAGMDFTPNFLFAAAANFATAPLLTAVYATTIILLCGSPAWRRRLSVLAPVGRLALSNYLLQSLIGSLIFTGYGLGLFGRVGAAAGLALSVAIFAAQIPLSAWWSRHFLFGPAEWLLRSFTYLRAQPFRRQQTSGGVAQEVERA
jgi:uncharacterized protein